MKLLQHLTAYKLNATIEFYNRKIFKKITIWCLSYVTIFANVTNTLTIFSVEQLALRHGRMRKQLIRCRIMTWKYRSTIWLSPYMWHLRLTVRTHFCLAFTALFRPLVSVQYHNKSTEQADSAQCQSVHSWTFWRQYFGVVSAPANSAIIQEIRCRRTLSIR